MQRVPHVSVPPECMSGESIVFQLVQQPLIRKLLYSLTPRLELVNNVWLVIADIALTPRHAENVTILLATTC